MAKPLAVGTGKGSMGSWVVELGEVYQALQAWLYPQPLQAQDLLGTNILASTPWSTFSAILAKRFLC